MASSAGGEWTWSDAWILASIMARRPRKGASLADVVRTADIINHAIPLDEEIEQAVRRLLGAGLISVEQRRFYVTRAGRVMARKTLVCRLWRLLETDCLERRLGRLPVREQAWSLEPGEMEKANAERDKKFE